MNRFVRLVICAAALLGTVAPSSAHAQGPRSPLAEPGGFRLLADFDLGFAGTSKIKFDGGSFDGDLGTTLGMRLQGQIPIGQLLYTGVGLGVDGYTGEDSPEDADRLVVIGIEGLIGIHVPIDLGSVVLEPTGGISIGLALGTANDVDLEDTEVGLAFGLRGGVNLWFSPNVGVNVRVGYQLHSLFLEDSGETATLMLQQFRFGLGGIFRFGA